MTTVTITLLLKRGNAQGIRFRDGEWQTLLQNAELKAQGFAFLATEYDDVRTLSDGLDKKVKRCPYIDFRLGSDFGRSEAYPAGLQLLAGHVAAFAVEFRKRAEATAAQAPPGGAQQGSRDAPQAEGTPIDVPPPSSWRLPLIVFGGFAALLMVTVGAALLWDYRKKKTANEEAPAFLMQQDSREDKKIDFSRVGRNETGL